MNAPRDLLDKAKTAFENAYAPYSKFQVGAALRTASGEIYSGANIENASYGLSRCAEQSAVQAMASAGKRDVSEVVVYTAAAEPASPCGACRQILYEFGPNASVFLVNQEGVEKQFKVRELLPDGFKLREKP